MYDYFRYITEPKIDNFYVFLSGNVYKVKRERKEINSSTSEDSHQ